MATTTSETKEIHRNDNKVFFDQFLITMSGSRCNYDVAILEISQK